MSNSYNDKSRELVGKEGMCVLIPQSIIFNQEIGRSRVLTYSYLSCKTTMDYSVCFSIYEIMEWVGKKVDRHLGIGSTTDDVIQALNYYKDNDLLKCDQPIKLGHSLKQGVFDKDRVMELIEQDRSNGYRFTKIYVDEIERITGYHEYNGRKLSADVVMLVFAYLRYMIPVSNNLAGAVQEPDAYDTHYKLIGEEIGLSERMVSKAIAILIDLGLIYERRRGTTVYYTKKKNGDLSKKFRENTYIFCNTTKRIKGKNGKPYMVAEGEIYYLHEADEKEDKLNRMSRKN